MRRGDIVYARRGPTTSWTGVMDPNSRSILRKVPLDGKTMFMVVDVSRRSERTEHFAGTGIRYVLVLTFGEPSLLGFVNEASLANKPDIPFRAGSATPRTRNSRIYGGRRGW